MFKSLIPTLSILTAIVLFLFVVRPQFQEAQLINADISEYQETIEDYQTFNAELAALLDAKNNISITDRERLDMLIPTTVDNTRLLVDIEALAKKNALLFGNVVIESGLGTLGENGKGVSETAVSNTNPVPANSNRLITNNISFALIGTYEQFKHFLSEIESSLSLMEVTKISLSAVTGRFQQYSVTVQTYALPEQN